MPVRRASGSATHVPRLHRSNDSQPFSNTPYASANPTTTPQQKVVHILVNRLKNKLPINSGSNLCLVEADEALQQAIWTLIDISRDSADIIGWALAELLTKLAKASDSLGNRYIEMLQSQLILLKILCAVLASRWVERPDDNPSPKGKTPMSSTSMSSLPGSPHPSKRNHESSNEHLPSLASSPWIPPPPLDDTCAQYILAVMVIFLRQTTPPEVALMPFDNLNFFTSFYDFETMEYPGMPSPVQANPYIGVVVDSSSVQISRHNRPAPEPSSQTPKSDIPTAALPQHFRVYEKTSQMLCNSSFNLNLLIAKFVGRILYHLSASNWNVIFARIRTKIHTMASNAEESPDTTDLQLMSHCLLDRYRLIQLLQELASLLVNMRKDAQAAMSGPLRSALWNWIDIFPNEYVDSLRSRSRMEGAPERVYDLLSAVKEVEKAPLIWPVLTALLCVNPFERTSADFSKSRAKQDRNFVDLLIRYIGTSSKFAEVAVVCLLDFARGISRTESIEELPWHPSEIAHEIKMYLMNYRNKKPFWDAEEIDVAVISSALVAIYRFLPEEEALEMFKSCMEPEQSSAVRLCVLQACIMLTAERHRLPWQRSLAALIATLAPSIRTTHLSSLTNRQVHDANGNVRQMRSRPKARKWSSEVHEDRELVVFSIMTLWRGDLPWHVQALTDQPVNDWVLNSHLIWGLPNDISVKLSTARSFKTISDRMYQWRPDGSEEVPVEHLWLKHVTPASIIVVSNSLLSCRFDFESQEMWVGIMFTLLEFYTIKTDFEHIKAIQQFEDRVPAFAIAEIACLVSLTSILPNVCITAARCLRLISEAERHLGVPVNEALSMEERVSRYPAFDQLGDPRIPVIGRVAFQKKYRRLLGHSVSNGPMHLAVWQELYFRLRILGESIKEASESPEAIDPDLGHPMITLEERRHQWRNLVLCLAAFGSTVSRGTHDPRGLTYIIPSKFLPDQMCTLKDPKMLLNFLFAYLIDSLVSEDLFIREVAKEALSTELSPRLFSRVFKYLDDVVRDITHGHKTTVPWADNFATFLDQFISIVKSLVEQVQAPEDLTSVDVLSILLSLATFLSRFPEQVAKKIRIKFCALCCSVLDSLDRLSLVKDNLVRQNILEIIIEWIQDPKAGSEAETSPQQVVSEHLQIEVNLAANRTVVRLMDKLQLQPVEAAGEDDKTVLSRLFVRYQKKGFQMVDMAASNDSTSEHSSTSLSSRAAEMEAEIRELLIQGSASLIAANPEIGLKHSLHYAYDQDLKKRATFARIFARMLEAGMRFDAPSLTTKQSTLCELVKGPDLALALAICETCPPSEVDFIIPVLLNLFDTRTSLMNLLKAIIEREVVQADSATSLFRRNTTSTRLLSAFARVHGYLYLRSLIIPLVQSMASMPRGHSYDLDPTKAGSQDLKQNQANVELIATNFLHIVISSVPAVPSMLHEICAYIGGVVSAVWPESKFAALGAFMFLRFITPAVVSPEIVDIEVPNDDGNVIRRGLMVIAKVFQNLANNIFFGKEAHMVSMNKFLEDNILVVTRFLTALNKYELSQAEDPNEWLGLTYDDTDTIVLHRFFDRHLDKVGKELLSLSQPSGGSDSSAVNGRRAWDSLCGALVDLGQPMEVPQPSSIFSDYHEEYQGLMKRYAHYDTSSVESLFVDADPQSPNAFFVLYCAKVESDTVDMEVFLYHVLKTLTAPNRESKPYELIVDMTGFAAASQLPVQWLKYIADIVPADIQSRMKTVRYLNTNSAAYRYLRRLHNLSAGTYSNVDSKSFASVAELADHVPPSVIAALSHAAQLEEEPLENFRDVTMRQDQQMRLPLLLDVGRSHIRLTSVRAQPLTASLSCRCTEIISLVDVSDVYNISTGFDPNEFIIRRIRHGVTLYFSSPQRDTIIKCIRSAKGMMKNVQLIGTERYSRLSNVSATLLHIGMFSSGCEEGDLRQAGFELVGAVCGYLDYDGPMAMIPVRGVYLSQQSNFLVIDLSERLSVHAPQLTLDFLSDVALAMDKADTPLKVHCLQYMSPWIKNLVHFPDPASAHYDHSGARLRDCVRLLINVTIANEEIHAMVQQYIWAEVAKLDSTVCNVVLDELMRSAVDGGVGSKRSEIITDTVGTLSSINVRGRLLSRLRKVIGKTATKPTKTLAENVHWDEIAALTRLVLVSGAHCKQAVQCQLFVPEIMYIVTLIAGTGQNIVRLSVHGIVLHALSSLTMGKSGESTPAPEIRMLMNKCAQEDTLRLFGLELCKITGEYISIDSSSERAFIEDHEKLAALLVQIMDVIAGSKGLLNVWRARWMSLVSSTAFQYSPALQARAFISLGTLANMDVDEDLFFQMLVAFKTALSQTTEADTTTIVSMLKCFVKVVPHLPSSSRFCFQLFWLAVSLLESAHMSYYVEATELLQVTLLTSVDHGGFDERGVSDTLLDARAPLEYVTLQLDRILGLSFDSSFSFSLAAVIFKGIRHSVLKDSAARVLRTLLRVTVGCKGDQEDLLQNPGRAIYHNALGYFISLLPMATTTDDFRALLADADADRYWLRENLTEDEYVPRVPLQLLGIVDSTTALYVTSFIAAMLITAQGDDGETEILYSILSDIGDVYPDIIAMAYESLHDKMKEIFANSSHPQILKAVSNVFGIAMQLEPGRVVPFRGSASTLSTVDESGPGRRHIIELESLGLQGLPSSFQFLPPNTGQGTRMINWIAELVSKMVEPTSL